MPVDRLRILSGTKRETNLRQCTPLLQVNPHRWLAKLSIGSQSYGALLLCCIAWGWPALSLADTQQQQLKDIQQTIVRQEKNVKQQLQQRNQLQKQLRQQEQSIAEAGKSLHATQLTLNTLQREINTLNDSIKKLQVNYTTQQKYLAEQLDTAFRQGKSSPLGLLFTGEESSRSERILAYFSYLNTARQHVMQELQQTREQLNSQKANLQHKQQQQQTLLAQQKSERNKLQAAQSARKGTLTSLESSLQQQQQRLDELKQNENRLRDKIAKAEREAKARAEREQRQADQLQQKQQQAKKSGSTYQPTADERSLMARTGGLGRPIAQNPWPVHGPILHHFGDIEQGELRWKGMVIGAQEGSEVKAIADGHVLLADWLQGYGLVVVVEHGKGDMSLYGYNQTALVSVGSQVKTGQPIALVGSSGGQERPALYFEIRRQGQAVNPQPWLRR